MNSILWNFTKMTLNRKYIHLETLLRTSNDQINEHLPRTILLSCIMWYPAPTPLLETFHLEQILRPLTTCWVCRECMAPTALSRVFPQVSVCSQHPHGMRECLLRTKTKTKQKNRLAYQLLKRDKIVQSIVPILKCSPLWVQTFIQAHLHHPVGTQDERTNTTTQTVWLVLFMWTVKPFISDPGVLYLLSASRKKRAANLLACK